MPDDDASYMLASWAKHFTRLLLEICRNMRKKLARDVLCKAGEIATRLQMVCPYIESLPRYWIEPDIDDLCRGMLEQLVTICLWPEKMHISSAFIVADCNNLLAKKTSSATKQCISKYFSHPENKGQIDSFNQDCRRLHEILAPTSAEEATNPPPNLQKVAQNDHSKYNQELFDLLEEIAGVSQACTEDAMQIQHGIQRDFA
ncbi:hypothetical protein QQX98_000503 [Neonectria punicea]|uniref:Uncharacterized protein n=1 Tax=Neonectria punicea TaxID=979145 RepID=A0ABR1HTH5_9HYPO